MPKLRCVNVKNISINQPLKGVISNNQLNYKAPEKSHIIAELVGYMFLTSILKAVRTVLAQSV